MNFLTDFTDFLKAKYTELPADWCKQLAHITQASVSNRDVWLKTNIGRNRCNIWIVLYAPSGRGYKSTPIDNVIFPILTAVGEKIKRYLILPSIASSIEGIIDRALDKKVGMSGLINRDEFTSFLKEGETKSYTASWENYSKMYDGWIYTRSTRKVQVINMIPVYVNLVGATTPRYAYNVLPIKFFFQGIGNRIEPHYHNPPGKEDYTEEDLFERMEWSDIFRQSELDPAFQPFIDELVDISKCHNYMCLSKEATEIAVKYKNEIGRKINSIPEESVVSFKREFYERNYQKALKHAQLITVSKYYRMKEMVILPEDLEEAIRMVQQSEKHFNTIVTQWLATPTTSIEKMANDLTILLTYLNKVRAFEIISQKRLAYEVGNTRRDKNFYRYVRYLEDAGCIKVIRDSAGICRKKGKEWMEYMHIDPSFKAPPILYGFKKLLTETKMEEVLERGVKRK